MNLDESDPTFCAMVNAARDEHVRLKGFAPYTADIIAMLKAALRSQGESIGAEEAAQLRYEAGMYQALYENAAAQLKAEHAPSPPENYDPTTQPFDEPFRHVERAPSTSQGAHTPPVNATARKWLNKADEIDRHIAEYDPTERHLSEVHALEVEAETLRECASELYATIPVPAVEEIRF